VGAVLLGACIGETGQSLWRDMECVWCREDMRMLRCDWGIGQAALHLARVEAAEARGFPMNDTVSFPYMADGFTHFFVMSMFTT